MLNLELTILADSCKVLNLPLDGHHFKVLMRASKLSFELVVTFHFFSKLLVENFSGFALIFQDPVIGLRYSHHLLLFSELAKFLEKRILMRYYLFGLRNKAFITVSVYSLIPHRTDTNLGLAIVT